MCLKWATKSIADLLFPVLFNQKEFFFFFFFLWDLEEGFELQYTSLIHWTWGLWRLSGFANCSYTIYFFISLPWNPQTSLYIMVSWNRNDRCWQTKLVLLFIYLLFVLKRLWNHLNCYRNGHHQEWLRRSHPEHRKWKYMYIEYQNRALILFVCLKSEGLWWRVEWRVLNPSINVNEVKLHEIPDNVMLKYAKTNCFNDCFLLWQGTFILSQDVVLACTAV